MADAKKAATKPAGLDISKLIEKAQKSYGKADKGLAGQLSTGSSIQVPNKDSDFVVWTKGPHWKALTGLRGIPFGRIVQISGKPDSGKSTHASVFMKEALDQDVLVILWDSEKKFAANRFRKMGGDPDQLVIVNTNNILNGAKAVAHLVNATKEMDPSKKILIVWDSVGASVNTTEDNGENEDYSKQPGVTAKEVAFAIRKFNKLQSQHENRETGEQTVATLVINQVYANIGSPGLTEKGGGELYYLSSLIIQLTRKGDLTRVRNGEKMKYGIVSRAKVKKNHMFEGDENVSEMEIVVSADGILLKKDVKKSDDILGWDDPSSTEDE